MAVLVTSTTAAFLYSTGGMKKSFVVEADVGNSTNNVRISSVDPNVLVSFITLKAGQQQVFNNWKGSLWAKASANAPTVYVELEDDADARIGTKGPGA